MEKSFRNNRLHSLIWNVIFGIAVTVYGETVCGALVGLLQDAASFSRYEIFSEIDMFIIVICLIVGRGIGIEAARCLGKGNDDEYQSVCAKGIRLSLITGAVLAVASVVASCVLFYDQDVIEVLGSPAISSIILEMLVAFLFPLLNTLRELAYVRRRLFGTIVSAIVYVGVFFVFTYLLVEIGWSGDAVVFAHFLAVVSSICVLAFSLKRIGQSFRIKGHGKVTGIKELLINGLPLGLGYALYFVFIYGFAQVPAGQLATGAAQNIQITYGSLSLGLQVLSSLISVILITSTILTVVCIGTMAVDKLNSESQGVLKRLLKLTGFIWLIIGIILFITAPIITDAIRITSDREINITLIGFRICALTLWAHSLVWIIIQYYVIRCEHKRWITLLATLFSGYILMAVSIKVFPGNMIVAWLIFAGMPIITLLVAWLCRKKLPWYSDNEADEKTSVSELIKSYVPSVKRLVIYMVAAVVLTGGVIISTLVYYEIDMLPDVIDESLFNFENRSKVVANDGTTVLADLYFPRHETLESLDEVSQYAVDAIVAREDCRFYQHIGVDPKGIARAAFYTVTGQGIQGGSTITMQLIKNSVLANTGQLRTFDRKISEMLLALRMEHIYDKDTILTMYLNNTYYGNGYYGIKSAAKHYFRKDPKDLTLAEAVSLSVFIQGPNDYRLASNDEYALEARARTLECMVRNGYITEEEKEQAASEMLNWNPFEVIINHSKVTPALVHDPVVTDGSVYLSVDDVSRYLDPYLYCRENEGVTATFGIGGVAEFNMKKGTVSVNGETGSTGLQKFGDAWYVPLSIMEDLYGIDVNYDENELIITSRNKSVISAKVNEEVPVNYLNSDLSYKVGIVKQGDTVYVQDTDGDVYDGWSHIRTSDGLVGYVKTEKLTEKTVEKEAEPDVQTVEFDEPLCISWDNVLTENNTERILEETKGLVNVIMPYCYAVRNGNVYDYTEVVDDDYIRRYNEAGYQVFPTFEHTATTDKDMDEMSRVFSTYETRKILIQQILEYVDRYQLKGINIDFEHMYMKDAENFTQFMRELKAQLEVRGCLLSVDVIAPDGDDDWAGCYEYWKLGMVVDYMVLMAYDYTSLLAKYSGSGAPYYWVEGSLDKLIHRENVPAEKLVLSIPLYMRLWHIDKETYEVIDCEDFPISATDSFIPDNAETFWLDNEQQNFAQFDVSKDVRGVCWMEDRDSLSKKIQLVKRNHIAGSALWLERYSNAAINEEIKKELNKPAEITE